LRVWLIDTGPLVAYLDGTDKEHSAVVPVLDSFTGQLVTTSAVIAEAMYFVAAVRSGPALLAELVEASGIQVYDFSEAQDLAEAARRMAKYGDSPMDFADATLVLLAEHLGVFDLLTLDRRGFNVFRSSRGKRFSLIMDRPRAVD
jgi:predicted nucleic acid-binding protein